MFKLRNRSIAFAVGFSLLAGASVLPVAAFAAAPMMGTKMVGGAAMYPTKNIVENAVNSKDHTTLVAAVKAAGLVDTLSGPGPFTVFAPTNAAFAKLPGRHGRHPGQAREQGDADQDPDLSRRRRPHDRRRPDGHGQGRRRQGHAEDRRRARR